MSSSPDRPANSTESIFSRLWIARDVAAVGEWMLFVGFLAYLSLFTDSPRTIALVVLARALPTFLLGPIAAWAINWRNAVAFGVAAQLFRAAMLLPLFPLEQKDGFEPVIQVAFLAAISTPFFSAANAALLGTTVVAERRNAAVRVLHNTSMLAATVGPAFGLILYGVTGLRGVAIASIAAAVASAGLLLSARGSRATGETKPEPLAPPLDFAPLPTGIMEALRNPVFQQIAWIQLLAALFAGGLIVVEAVYMTTGLMVTGDNVAVVLAGQGLGMLVGAFGYYRFGRLYGLNTLVTAGLALTGGGMFGLALSSSLPAGTALAAVIGIGIGFLTASLAEEGPRMLNGEGEGRRHLGLWTLVQGMAVLSILAAGPLAESISARFTLVLSGVLLSTLALYAFGAVPDTRASSQTDDPSKPVQIARDSAPDR